MVRFDALLLLVKKQNIKCVEFKELCYVRFKVLKMTKVTKSPSPPNKLWIQAKAKLSTTFFDQIGPSKFIPS